MRCERCGGTLIYEVSLDGRDLVCLACAHHPAASSRPPTERDRREALLDTRVNAARHTS